VSDLAPSPFPHRPRVTYYFAGRGARLLQRAVTALISMINLLRVLALVLYGLLAAAVPFGVEVGWAHAVVLCASFAVVAVLTVAALPERTR